MKKALGVNKNEMLTIEPTELLISFYSGDIYYVPYHMPNNMLIYFFLTWEIKGCKFHFFLVRILLCFYFFNFI